MDRRGFLGAAAELAVAPLVPAAEQSGLSMLVDAQRKVDAAWGIGHVESFRFIQSEYNQEMAELLDWMQREVR